MALKIRNEEEYQALLAQISSKDPAARAKTKQVPAKKESTPSRAPKPLAKKAAAEVLEALVEEVVATKGGATGKKRRGVEETPILTSLRDCSIEVEASATHVAILFKGARLFTLNEIYAMLQYRKYVVFAYKKQWHTMVQNALRLMGASKPRFEGPCKVTLFRQGKRPVDRDSLMVMFKYIIDALKDDSKHSHVGVFPDDNPDIVFDDEKIQTTGDPMVGIRVDLIQPAPPMGGKDARDLFDRPPASLSKPSPDVVGVSDVVIKNKPTRPRARLVNPASKPKTAPKPQSPKRSKRSVDSA